MSKYEKLCNWIVINDLDKFKPPYTQIEEIAGVKIDHSFLKYKKELLNYGYRVEKVSMKEETISFKKV